MIKIDFNDLIDNYNTNLLDNLRGFGSNEEYLKFYVPGTSSIKSFYNLIDALFEGHQLEFIIYYKKDTFEKKFIEEIDLFLKEVGIVEKITNENLISLKIGIKKNFYQKFQSENKTQIIAINSKKMNLNKNETKDEILIFKSEQKLNKPYSEDIHKIIANDYYSKEIITNENLFSGVINNHKIYFIIENRIITKIFHDCENDKLFKKLLNIFCDICVNKNIQEAAEHSVIYLEEKIRLKGNHLIKTGIILPSHAGIYFDDLNIFIRKLFNEFVKKNSIEFGVNKNYLKKSYYWVNLDEKVKLEKINFIIREITNHHNLGDQSAIAQTIDSNFRINLGVDKSFKILQEKKNILLEMEIKLKKLDDTLEVFVDEQLDKNKLRIKNSPQTKLLN